MTHFSVLVIVEDDGTDIDEAIGRLLAPYDENSEMFRDGSRWDWWVRGGRWTGMLDPDYDPYTDPRNLETCRFCDDGITTARVAAQYPAYHEWIGKKCRQCGGTGKTVKWELAPWDNDVMRADEIDFTRIPMPAAVVTPDGEWHEQGRTGWWGTTILNEKGEGPMDDGDWTTEVARHLLDHPDCLVCVVDCHV